MKDVPHTLAIINPRHEKKGMASEKSLSLLVTVRGACDECDDGRRFVLSDATGNVLILYSRQIVTSTFDGLAFRSRNSTHPRFLY